MRSNEQKLIDICFQLVLAATDDADFCKEDNESKARWVAHRLREHGFDTKPCGASWGVLKRKVAKDKEERRREIDKQIENLEEVIDCLNDERDNL